MQEKSYYALRLPQGWWLFGLDLALVDDIDMCQCKCASLPCPALAFAYNVVLETKLSTLSPTSFAY